jgi:hypothetical protein
MHQNGSKWIKNASKVHKTSIMQFFLPPSLKLKKMFLCVKEGVHIVDLPLFTQKLWRTMIVGAQGLKSRRHAWYIFATI